MCSENGEKTFKSAVDRGYEMALLCRVINSSSTLLEFLPHNTVLSVRQNPLSRQSMVLWI